MTSLRRRSGGENFESLQPDDIMELINSQEQDRLSGRNLKAKETMNILPHENESKPATVEILKIPNIPGLKSLFCRILKTNMNVDL